MELCTEFLIHIDKHGGIATTDNSFKNLLMSNSDIKITNKFIEYQGKKHSFSMQSGDIKDTEVRFYHIFITLVLKPEEEENCFENDDFKSYQKLLTAVKQIFYGKGTRDDGRMLLENNAVSFEILWDDVSLLCSQKAYPLIYKIENLMRKLITKFMLVNIGTEWENRNIPDAMKNGKNKIKTNAKETGYLYQRDFIELSDYLFKAYPMKRSSINDLMKTKDTPEAIPYEELKDYFLISNWDRYFKSILDVDSEQLKKQWKELYDLRCDIAHNNLFSVADYQKVVKLINELKPKIQNAIDKLDEIRVDTEERERISEERERIFEEQERIHRERMAHRAGCRSLPTHQIAVAEFIEKYAILKSLLDKLVASISADLPNNYSLRQAAEAINNHYGSPIHESALSDLFIIQEYHRILTNTSPASILLPELRMMNRTLQRLLEFFNRKFSVGDFKLHQIRTALEHAKMSDETDIQESTL